MTIKAASRPMNSTFKTMLILVEKRTDKKRIMYNKNHYLLSISTGTLCIKAERNKAKGDPNTMAACKTPGKKNLYIYIYKIIYIYIFSYLI